MAAIVDNRIRRNWRSETGAELVEFALTLPLLLLVIFGIIDFGFLFQRYEIITNAAREGARLATLPDYGADLETNVTSRVNQYLLAADLDPADADVSVTPGTIVIAGKNVCTYEVRVTYPHAYSFVAGIMGYFGGTLAPRQLEATSTRRLESAC
jgi:Flp pilus assembly protein TadG